MFTLGLKNKLFWGTVYFDLHPGSAELHIGESEHFCQNVTSLCISYYTLYSCDKGKDRLISTFSFLLTVSSLVCGVFHTRLRPFSYSKTCSLLDHQQIIKWYAWSRQWFEMSQFLLAISKDFFPFTSVSLEFYKNKKTIIKKLRFRSHDDYFHIQRLQNTLTNYFSLKNINTITSL